MAILFLEECNGNWPKICLQDYYVVSYNLAMMIPKESINKIVYISKTALIMVLYLSCL